MRSLHQRVFVTLAATVLLAIMGAGAGYLLGCRLAMHQAWQRMAQLASMVIYDGDNSSSEARKVLTAINLSPYAPCSDGELDYLRRLVFAADTLKDAGRFHNGALLCSAFVGRLKEPMPIPKPDFVQPDGSKVYWNLAPLKLDKSYVSMEQNEAFVNFTAHTKPPRQGGPDFVIAITDRNGRPYAKLGSKWLTTTELRFVHDGQGVQGSTLYSTRCSTRYFNCVTASVSIPEVIKSARGLFWVTIIGGTLVGVLLGLLLTQFYRHTRGMEQQLRRAIRRNQIRVLYQPVVDLSTGRIVAAEALSRWTDEEGFTVSPEVFIRLAEARGFAHEITQLVIDHVIHDCRECFEKDLLRLVGVNISATELTDPECLLRIDRQLQQGAVQASRIAFELTENSTAAHASITDALQALRRAGHTVSIDDFGTGYSSLAYLHQLSVDAIKIDKSFTRALSSGSMAASLLPQMLSMGRTLGLSIVIEGIETEEEAEYFRQTAQPIYAQGWHFGKPMEISQLLHLIEENHRLTKEPCDVA